MSGITLTEVADATIPTPPAGKVTEYFSTEEAGPAWKDDTGTVHGHTGAAGPTGPGYGGTSTTSLAIGTGSKAFTTQAGLAYLTGARVRAASDADPTVDYMEGVVASYAGTTLTVTMDLIGGSGTHTDWSLNIAGEQGIQGAGVPPTFVTDTVTAGAVTHDYGDGTAHASTVDAALTVTLTGWVAGENIMTIDYTTDGTGGYGVPTFGAEVINAADLAAVWNDSAGALNTIALRTTDSGTTVKIANLPVPIDYGLDADITTEAYSDVADAGTSPKVARADHLHGMPASGGGGGVPARCGASVYRNAATQNVNNTEAALTFDTEIYDTDNFWVVGSPTRMTVPTGKGGVYIISGGSFSSGATLWIGIYKNGAAVIGGGLNKPDAASAYMACHTQLALAATDYVELRVQTSTSINFGHASVINAYSYLTLTQISD